MWDVFISHAAEDKERVARPLADALAAAGFRVWYDEFTLRLGDGLSRSIDRGLAESRYGIVILSPSFFAKAWPRRELDGLTVRELSAGKVILPIWHEVSHADVERYSPTLADKLGVSTERGVAYVVAEVARVLRDEPGAAGATPPVKPPTPSRPPRWRQGWRRVAIAAAAVILVAVSVEVGRRVQGPASMPVAARPDLNGRWAIPATERTPKTYLDLPVVDGQVSGTSETLYSNHPDMTSSGLASQRKTMILGGRLTKDGAAFNTRRQYLRRLGDSSTRADLIQRYDGRLDGRDTIRFAMQVDGGYFEDVVAERVVAVAPASLPVATLEGHRGTVNRMINLPGERLASASSDRTVRVWDLATGRSILELAHEGQVHSVLAVDGDRLLTADDTEIREWELGSGKPLRSFEKIEGRLLTLVPLAGGRLAGSDNHGRIVVWSLATSRVETTMKADDTIVERLAPLPDGRLVSGDSDGALRLWDTAKGRSLAMAAHRESGTGHPVTGLEAMPDGRLGGHAERLRPSTERCPA